MKIHARSPRYPNMALCGIFSFERLIKYDSNESVTCKLCLKALERVAAGAVSVADKTALWCTVHDEIQRDENHWVQTSDGLIITTADGLLEYLRRVGHDG